MGEVVLKNIIKSILCVISWCSFFLMVMASCCALLCAVIGTAICMFAVFVPSALSALEFYSIGFFGSLAVITTICIIFSVYEYAIKYYRDKRL